ncbi:MAG: Acetyl xylan esterase [Planctomycetota bacterium]|nr:Acetyl xylan esterase [Planctomycetota bacterium]
MMRRHFVILTVLTGVSVSPLPMSRGEDRPNTSKVFVASDFPALAKGVRIERSGDYTLKVWSPARFTWTMASEGARIMLSVQASGDAAAPRWTSLGPIALKGDMPVSVQVVGASFEPAEIVGNYQSQKQTVKPAKSVVPVPAVASLSIDPAFTPDLQVLRGNIDATGATDDSRRSHLRTNHEGANFHFSGTQAQWRDRARDLREQLQVTLGLSPMPPRTPLNPKVFGKVDRNGYTIEKVTLETLPGMYLAGNLYRPVGNCRRIPAILCPHGHWEDGRVNPEVQARCIRWAKLGAVVFLYDMVGYNDSKPFGHEFLNDRLDAWGLSLFTLQTWNSLRSVDWIATLPDVDPARIGCTGESGGGTQTFVLTALDPRIAVSAPVVMVSERFQGGCLCENASGMRHGTDNVEIAALMAPRPMMIVGATGDWSSNTLTKVHPAIRDIYELVGAPDQLEAALFNFPHNYNQTSRNAVYAFMSRWLLGIDDAASTREGAQTPEKPEDLWAFNEKNPAPGSVLKPDAMESKLIDLRRKQLAALAPSEDSTSWDASRTLLATSHRIRVGISSPAAKGIVAREVRRAAKDDLSIGHWVVGREDGGEKVPVVRLSPAKPSGRVAVVFHDRGKAGLSTQEGEPIPTIRAMLDRGMSVVGFDPLLVGESFDPSAPAHRRPKSAHFSTYNATLAADRMSDLATVVAWTRSLGDVREVSLVGLGSAGPLALLARPRIDGLARTYVDLEGFDYGDGSAVPDGLRLPGVLQFGGLPSAAALASPMPLWITNPGATFNKSWPTSAYRLADASSALKIDEAASSAENLARWLDVGE